MSEIGAIDIARTNSDNRPLPQNLSVIFNIFTIASPKYLILLCWSVFAHDSVGCNGPIQLVDYYGGPFAQSLFASGLISYVNKSGQTTFGPLDFCYWPKAVIAKYIPELTAHSFMSRSLHR